MLQLLALGLVLGGCPEDTPVLGDWTAGGWGAPCQQHMDVGSLHRTCKTSQGPAGGTAVIKCEQLLSHPYFFPSFRTGSLCSA